jgi:outer membrane receptor for ferrienterochelin and colicins
MLKNISALLAGMAILLGSLVGNAQNIISGTVRTTDNKILPGANVTIKNTTLGAASDSEGRYSIQGLKDGAYELRVSFFGYETVEKPVTLSGNKINLDFTLQETSIDLNAVVVTGTRTEKNLKNTPVLTQSIGIRELLNKDVSDIAGALEASVPGIEFSSTAAGKSVSLQGIDPQYMLFLVDGERLAGETYGNIDYSRINMAGIERIEVVKGAGSTLYGSNALGGVINVITKTPVQKFTLAASSRFSKYNTQNYQLSIGSKAGKFSTQTSVVFDNTNGYDLLKGDSYRTQEREDALVINEVLKFSPSGNFQMEGRVSFLIKNRDNTSASLYDRRNSDFTYGAKATWFINAKNNFSLSWNSDNYELLNKITKDNLESDYNNLYQNARLLGNFHLAKWNLLTAGTEYISENLTAPRNKIEDKSNTDFIFYAQEDIRLSENLTFTGGLRAHNNSEYGWHYTPQVAAMFKIWHFAFRGNFGMGYKTPSLKEKYMSFQIPAPGPPMFLVGFEGLKPETSKYTSISAEYTRQGVSFSVSGYKNDISDMISENLDEFTVKPGGIIEYTYRNYDHVMVKGIDILLKTDVVKNFIFSGLVSFSEKYDHMKEKVFENARKFNGKFNTDYHWSSGIYLLDLNLQSNFYGKKTISLMDEVTHKNQDLDLKAFSLWKITSTHTFRSKYFIRAGVDNIFNFMDSSGGYNNGTPGRTVFLGLGLHL